MSERIIIVEDDQGVRFFLEEALKGEGYRVDSFESYEDAARSISNSTDLLIMDISLPGLDGLSATTEIKNKYDVPILIITAYGTKKNALEAIKRGATDFFVKPILLDELKVMLKRVLGTRRLKKEVEELREKELENHIFHGVVGKSPQMKEIFKEVEKIAGKGLSVLITGETGVGKEEIAKLVHLLSKRKGEFIVVNCASIPDNLLESELFGYEKGAFTGAVQQKAGKFEVAHRGTIVLDEIGEMSPYLQAKLLRVVEKQEIEHLGSTKTKKVDIHVISTTNRVLENEIRDGKFREDLFFRLSQIHIQVPPLRERRADVTVLVDYALRNIEQETGRVVMISDDATGLLINYSWPGNARELIGIIRRASVMCDGDVIGLDDLPLHFRAEHPLSGSVYSDQSLDDAISVLEKNMIVDALKKVQGSQAKAAKILGISERSMWYRVKKYEIET
ncbi:MAG: sigma-54-dependent Fis family transcriptional regulator [Syntrophorhabdaceae bacterium]|nr:sigma-54-dependent Fis family transcriptional regulator [Syntrophorhabdaceae bacterium]